MSAVRSWLAYSREGSAGKIDPGEQEFCTEASQIYETGRIMGGAVASMRLRGALPIRNQANWNNRESSQRP